MNADDFRLSLSFPGKPISKYGWPLEDFRKSKKIFWRCPAGKRLFETLQRVQRETHIGFAIYSVVPVLALAAWTDSKTARWTRLTIQSQTRIAALSGTSGPTVRRVIDALIACDLLREQKVLSSHSGMHVFAYRLRAEPFYPRKREKYFQFRGAFVYGGWWSLLPSHATRAVYLAIAALDPVRNDRALRSKIVEDCDGANVEFASQQIHAYRSSRRYSLSDLSRALQMSKPTVIRAVKQQRRRLLFRGKKYRYVRAGKADKRGIRWLAPSRRLIKRLPSSVLSSEGFRATRESVWTG